MGSTSVTSSFNSVSIPAGHYIWFNSSFDPGPLPAGTDPVTIYVTNSVISFTVNSVPYTLTVPDARIRLDATVTSATTQFINNRWETVVPRSYTSDIFMTGLSYLVPVNIPGNYMNVKWTSTISLDKPGISLGWRWGAAVYGTFGNHAGLNIKSINGSTQNPYANIDRAGTPENYKGSVENGAKGAGGTNYTGSFTSFYTATCSTNSGQRPITVVTTPNRFKDELLSAKFEVLAMPNPSNGYFNLLIKGNTNNPVNVRVLDIFGRVMERYETINVNTTLKIGNRLSGGAYYVEVIQGEQRKVIKIT
jgi:hypothetical protein